MHAAPIITPEQCLEVSPFFDWDSPHIREFADRAVGDVKQPVEVARLLFNAVRDGWRYDPFCVTANASDYRASTVAQSSANWCVPKSILLASCARYKGIPAALGLADVTNHLSSEKLRQAMGSDVFYNHGYTAFWLDNRWVKASSAFNRQLCERMGVAANEFDGASDALSQQNNVSNQTLEYLRDHGLFADVPFETMMNDFATHYNPQAYLASQQARR